jgi:uncharacterized protein YidB (DUF937 family)
MGLLDILNGMQNGPGGQGQPTSAGSGSSSGGFSPLMMALIGLLAYKALKGFGGSQTPAGGTPAGGGMSSGTPGGGSLADVLGGLLGGRPGGSAGSAAPGGGSLGDLLGGLLGGGPTSGGSKLPGGIGGRDAGNVLGSGLGNLIRDLQNSGQGRVAQSWVAKGPNQEIKPNDLAKALGADVIQSLSAETGMSRDDLLAGLSRQLPDLVDQLTPEGRLPTEREASRWL